MRIRGNHRGPRQPEGGTLIPSMVHPAHLPSRWSTPGALFMSTSGSRAVAHAVTNGRPAPPRSWMPRLMLQGVNHATTPKITTGVTHPTSDTSAAKDPHPDYSLNHRDLGHRDHHRDSHPTAKTSTTEITIRITHPTAKTSTTEITIRITHPTAKTSATEITIGITHLAIDIPGAVIPADAPAGATSPTTGMPATDMPPSRSLRHEERRGPKGTASEGDGDRPGRRTETASDGDGDKRRGDGDSLGRRRGQAPGRRRQTQQRAPVQRVQCSPRAAMPSLPHASR